MYTPNSGGRTRQDRATFDQVNKNFLTLGVWFDASVGLCGAAKKLPPSAKKKVRVTCSMFGWPSSEFNKYKPQEGRNSKSKCHKGLN